MHQTAVQTGGGGRRRNSAPTLEPPPLQGKATDRLMGRTVGVRSTSVGCCRRLHELTLHNLQPQQCMHMQLKLWSTEIAPRPEEGVEDGENSATPRRASGSERIQPVWRWGGVLHVPAPSAGVSSLDSINS